MAADAVITLTVAADRPRLQGFSHFWAMYVTGFNPAAHCIKCLLGVRSAKISRIMPCDGTPIAMNEAAHFDYLYVCGVTRFWSSNFHLVLRPKPSARVAASTFNAIAVEASGAEAVPIPALEDGFNGLPKAFTSCRNYQFGVSAYSRSTASAAL